MSMTKIIEQEHNPHQIILTIQKSIFIDNPTMISIMHCDECLMNVFAAPFTSQKQSI